MTNEENELVLAFQLGGMLPPPMRLGVRDDRLDRIIELLEGVNDKLIELLDGRR